MIHALKSRSQTAKQNRKPDGNAVNYGTKSVSQKYDTVREKTQVPVNAEVLADTPGRECVVPLLAKLARSK